MPEVNPGLAAAIVRTPDEKLFRTTLKILAASEQGIIASLEPGEYPLCVAFYLGDFGGSMIALVTDRRTVEVKKGRFVKELRHHEVAETTIGKLPSGYFLVRIESTTSRLDYRHDDPARYQKIIQFDVSTLRVAQTICGAIDARLGSPTPEPVHAPPSPAPVPQPSPPPTDPTSPPAPPPALPAASSALGSDGLTWSALRRRLLESFEAGSVGEDAVTLVLRSDRRTQVVTVAYHHTDGRPDWIGVESAFAELSERALTAAIRYVGEARSASVGLGRISNNLAIRRTSFMDGLSFDQSIRMINAVASHADRLESHLSGGSDEF